MMKIEMAIEFTPEYPQGRRQELMWMHDMVWPVPSEKHADVLKVEAFGEELDLAEKLFREMTSTPIYNKDMVVVDRVWYGNNAQMVSREMRAQYPPKDA